ncbi:uncharacterized protein A1O9_10508 [Exophiala aquamarina CBS 119918]|uniref:NAD dependent epimerase/dehydratase n=1 Tax=Exophiala aquamarina CBS 119918 TaxID=1182545 RepID=A0A072P2N4_9EURO|nr:uncharacterized protein A1O9_10508 [Exophiala aquamarina CBS 119918]KEF53533.1 hypothetical protein A1O9_10508 [Exophiala aquamarina CBS 119918]
MAPHKPKPQIPLDHTGPMEVVCLGLPRCATSTLKLILEETLAIGPCMHMSRCLLAPEKMALVERALRELDQTKRRALLNELFKGCAATADFPGHLFVEDLVVMYPNAKFVLNIRGSGAKSWSESMQEAIAPFLSLKYRVACWWSLADWQHYQAEVAWDEFVKRKLGGKSFCHEEVYRLHNDWVRRTVKESGKRLLEWEPGMGYEPLCEFIGKEVPDGEIPKTNERGQMKRVLAWRIKIGLKLWLRNVMLPTALISGIAVAYTIS